MRPWLLFHFVGIGNSNARLNRIQRLGAIVIGASLMFGGCAADQEPPTPNRSTVTQPPPEPEPEEPDPAAVEVPDLDPPQMPPEHNEDSFLAAHIMAHYYFDARNYAYSVNDAALIEEISHPECQVCNRHISDIKGAQEDGLKYLGGSISVGDATDARHLDDQVLFKMPLVQQPFTYVLSNGEVHLKGVGQETQAQVLMVLTSEGWKVRALGSEVSND